MPEALKKTQPRHTNWKVRKRCTHTRTGPSATAGSPRRTRLVRRRCPKLCPAPCSTPQKTNVQAAPCHRPPSTMVIMMLQHRPRLAARVAPERDVQVVAQPARQRHVPASPEVLQVARRVGRVEVLGEPEAEQQRQSDGDVGVAAEVAVDLHRVAPRREDRLRRGVLRGEVKTGVTIALGHVRGDDHLLEQAGQDQPEGTRVVDRVGVAPAPDLGQQLGAPHDRPGQQVREERDVDREVERLGRLELAPVDVDHVADGHEGEEGDRDGQPDLQQGDRPGPTRRHG